MLRVRARRRDMGRQLSSTGSLQQAGQSPDVEPGVSNSVWVSHVGVRDLST